MNVIKWYALRDNTQELKTYNEFIDVEKGKWIEINGNEIRDGKRVLKKTTWPIKSFERYMSFENTDKEEWVYLLKIDKEKNNIPIDCFIKLDYWQNQQFLWNQRHHWLQDKDIYKFLIPTLISMLSLFVAYLAYIK